MTRRPARLALGAALAAALALPGAALAAGPASSAPPADVVTWQQHVDHMRAMGPNLGTHIRDCIAEHGSMARLLGPNGMMVSMMGEEVML